MSYIENMLAFMYNDTILFRCSNATTLVDDACFKKQARHVEFRAVVTTDLLNICVKLSFNEVKK